jgi:L-serine kinase (ATP) / ParB family transcriptional regulator, heme-responsive regulator
MINYTVNFFELEILRIKDIKLHETTEYNRLRNVFDRIAGSKHLMNPVIVGRYNKDLILIDGANRLSTLKEIGCKLAIAQVIDYKNSKIKLKRWHHLVYNLGLSDIISFCGKLGLTYSRTPYIKGAKLLKDKFNFVLASDINKNESLIINLPKNFRKTIEALNAITKMYFNVYDFDRSEEEITIKDLRKYTRKKGTLIEFPCFTKKQIVEIANNHDRVPAGITRHILENRVLHVRYELEKLKDEKQLVKLQNELEKNLLNKIDKNKVRQYRESVIVFDE